MSDFEKIYVDGVPTEEKIEIEDHCIGEGLCYRDPLNNPDLLDESSAIGKKYKLAQEICKDSFTIDIRLEKQESKIAEQPDNSRRAIKKGSKRHNKI